MIQLLISPERAYRTLRIFMKAGTDIFWLAGIVFAASDITGLLRVSLSNNKYTYFVTTTIYTAAFLMLCVSVYSTSRKEVGSRPDKRRQALSV